MILMAFDAGASLAGVAVLRVVFEPSGAQHVECVRQEHVRLEMDGGVHEGIAAERIAAIADHALQLAGQHGRIVAVVEGVEGYVYHGNQPAPLFDTADQAGAIRMGIRMWSRMRNVERRVDVLRTTAAAVRKFLFHGQVDGAIGDSEVVLAVQQVVRGMPAIALPAKDHDKAMHAYDAAATGVWALARTVGWTSVPITRETLTEIARVRILLRTRTAEKKALKAFGLQPKKKAQERKLTADEVTLLTRVGALPKKVETRGTKRRRREGAAVSRARRAS